MSYCIAWKHGNNVFMLSDTAISSRVDEPMVPYNSMGEVQTTHFGYYVEEGLLKLIKIASDFAVSFATEDVTCAWQMIETIRMLYENLSDTYKFSNLLHDFKATYGGNVNTSLLLTYSFGQDDVRIYKFSGGKFQESDYADIGSGKTTKTLAQDMKTIIDKMYVDDRLNNTDPNYYLALVSATLQCYFYHNQYFKLGIGGIVTGLFLNYKVHFCRNLEFYMFEDNINCGNSLSVINRYNSFFSSSQIGHQRGYINQVLDAEVFADEYILSGISKSLNTKLPYYYVFFCNSKNSMVFMEINGQPHNIFFSRFIRRDLEKTDYAYIFSPDLEDKLTKIDDSKYTLPAVCEIGLPFKWPYESYKQLKEIFEKKQESKGIRFDYDFEVYGLWDFDKGKLLEIKKEINCFHNLVVVDYEYLYKIIKEKYELYHPYYIFDLKDLNFPAICQVLRELIPKGVFEKYCIIVVRTDNEKKLIDGYDLDLFLQKYPNIFNVVERKFVKALFELLKHYYIDDRFFHIDKFVIIADDDETARLLIDILPEYNYKQYHPDVFLIRNMNFETTMPGGLRYAVADLFVAALMKLSTYDMGILEAIAYGEIEMSKDDISKLPFNC